MEQIQESQMSERLVIVYPDGTTVQLRHCHWSDFGGRCSKTKKECNYGKMDVDLPKDCKIVGEEIDGCRFGREVTA